MMRTCFLCFLLISITCRSGICGDENSATFYRAINLSGPTLVIDGRTFEGDGVQNLHCEAKSFENQTVALKPRTDRARAQMVRSSRWGEQVDVELQKVPAGTYQVFLYVWEDNAAAQYELLLNDQTKIRRHNSGSAGTWQRLGPWKIAVSNETIKVSARGGHANLSGIEVWSGEGRVPDPMTLSSSHEPTADQLIFFESKIRPVLVDRCYECHSADASDLGGGLLLDSRAGIVKGGDTEPPIIFGEPDSSLLVKAISHRDPVLKMPPDEKLSESEIADLAAWVKMGAPDPRTDDTVAKLKSKTAINWDEARQFWSLQPIRAARPPDCLTVTWPTSDIDKFILKRLEECGLKPAAVADRRTLIRRATFDLVGLPPTPEEIAAFENDTANGAFARVVDRLLESPRYGERWGRHWLDVVRYSDTAGDNSDFPIPQMYRYRNWVIDAFNHDMPFDQFVTEQLAGDLLSSETTDQAQQRTIATGYIANARRFGSRVDDYPQHLTIEDTIDNLGRTFLATTINCARCHDHKFDPVSADDYYALYGIFGSTRYPWPGIELDQKQRDFVPLVGLEESAKAVAARKTEQELLDAEVKRLEKLRDAAEGDAKKEVEKQVEAAKKLADEHAKSALPFEQAYAVADAEQIENAAVHIKGDPTRAGDVVPRRFLTVLGGQTLPQGDVSSGRLELAKWITSPENPLTARVMVNRIWLYHFGRGLVPTPSDFGRQGKPPSHPELLDWLASRFIASRWSIKEMHRTIMLSRTYELSSQLDPNARELDATGELLSAFPRRRLDAEAIRDTLLILGNTLDLSPVGPHPFPPQAKWKFTQHNPFKEVYPSNHRSVYLMTQRIQRHPYLAVFDGADPASSTPMRITSTTPLQALFLLNDSLVHEQAQKFGLRVIHEEPCDDERLDHAYELALGRLPTTQERESGTRFLAAAAKELSSAGVPIEQLEEQTWQAMARVIFRLNEFVYVD